VSMVMNLRIPRNFGKFSSSCLTSVFSRRAQLHKVNYVVSLKTGKAVPAFN
jgi:hypothetical protein